MAEIDLRTRQDKLVGRLVPETMQLHVRWRDEEAVFDLPALAKQYGVLVRIRASDDEVQVRQPVA